MQDLLVLHHSNSLTLQATTAPSPSPPPWFSEVLLHAQLWVSSGLLSSLQLQVLVSRPRMGLYEVCDFVLFLLAYSVSAEPTLKLFFTRILPYQGLLASLWQRNKLPVASTLSRFLLAVSAPSCEALRALFEKDLFSNGLPSGKLGGLFDRLGERHLLFDADGTTQVARQRALAHSPDRPAPFRRLDKLCAKGYTGRKRGELVRTRLTLQQAHTHEWLGTFGHAGNGEIFEDLARACQVSLRYLAAHQLAPAQGLLRLDGLYGFFRAVSLVAGHGLGYLTRGKEYGLLEHPTLAPLLGLPTELRFVQPETHTEREVYDFPGFEWSCASDPQKKITTRVIVTARPVSEQDKAKGHKIGKRLGDKIYELFFTDRKPEALTAQDLLSLYFARGGFEQTLREEDLEQDPDRWTSSNPHGQEFWQILSQWVWNLRLRLGAAALAPETRCTLWSPAQLPSEPREETSGREVGREPACESRESLVATQPVPQEMEGSKNVLEPRVIPAPIAVKEPAKKSGEGEPARVVAPGGRGTGRLGGADFRVEGEVVICPAGKEMHRMSVRQEGEKERVRYEAKKKDCRSCKLAPKCLGKGEYKEGGRSVSVVRWPRVRKERAESVPCAGKEEAPPAYRVGERAVYWYDLESRGLRKEARESLWGQRVEVEKKPTESVEKEEKKVWTREERAHRRKGWEERRARNASRAGAESYSIRLSGVPSLVLEYLEKLRVQAS